jgi:hypothetical protein
MPAFTRQPAARRTARAATASPPPRPPTDPSNSRLTRWLLAGGAAGPLIFIAVFLVEGATRPGYSVWRNYVSDLELGHQGWEQIANFLICGTLVIGLAIALHRVWPNGPASRWGPALVGVFGLSLIAAGVFVTDPGRGYPPGATLKGNPTTLHGYIHGINALIAFNALIAASFVLARRFAAEPGGRAWARYCWITGTVSIVLEIGSNIGSALAENRVINFPTGLDQRATIIIGWVWLALTALRLLRRLPPPTATLAPPAPPATPPLPDDHDPAPRPGNDIPSSHYQAPAHGGCQSAPGLYVIGVRSPKSTDFEVPGSQPCP